MSQQYRTGSTAFALTLLCALILAPAGAAMAAAKASAAKGADPAIDFRTLAQQRPWVCADQNGVEVPRTGWSGGVAECVWQNRLRMRSWRGAGGVERAACVSAQAQWWAWARAGSPAAASPAVWRSNWAGHSLVDERGLVKRIVIVRRLLNGEWGVSEWRWTPSPRAATRRWQESRWKLLAARAQQFRAPAEAQQGQPETRMLRAVLEANLASRVAEIGDQSWRWQVDGLCLNVDAVGLGQQIMQLPYAVDDSRLEQRAAMQLQLARRYPKATWLTDFTLVPAAARARGGAKFYAVWIERGILKGQLWIPTKGDGPLVRLRITTALPAAPGGEPDAQAVARAELVVQRELTGLASRWASAHE